MRDPPAPEFDDPAMKEEAPPTPDEDEPAVNSIEPPSDEFCTNEAVGSVKEQPVFNLIDDGRRRLDGCSICSHGRK
jgi:hypothetical protein